MDGQRDKQLDGFIRNTVSNLFIFAVAAALSCVVKP